MKANVKKAAAAASSALLLTGMGAAGVMALNPAGNAADAAGDPVVEEVLQQADATYEKIAQVNGTFAFTQGEVTPIESIAKNMTAAAKYFCSSQMLASGEEIADTNNWPIAVGGKVGNSFVSTLGDLSEEGSAQLVMGCSCAGNPADGQGSVNAEVLGVSLSYIMEQAQVDSAANTVVFTADDGYEVALPLFYVAQHFSLIAYDVNGQPLDNSMGGANQLWLGSTAASYFARNITSITFEERQTPPPTPGTAEAGDAYPNTPNVSIRSAENGGA